MKKVITLILGVSVSFSVLAQKKELKSVEKLIKRSNFTEAAESIKGLESLAKDTEYESYYYFLLGKIAFGDEEDATVDKDYKTAGINFYKTLDVEYKTGEKDYSEKAISYLNIISDSYFKKLAEYLKKEDYKNAGDVYETLYNIRPERKDLLENVLNCRINEKNYPAVAKITEKMLKILGDKTYSAINKHTLRNNEFFKKEDRDKAIKEATHITPGETEVNKALREEYYNNLIVIYDQQGNIEKELVKLKEAKKEFPKNVKFFENYANVIYKTGDKEAYVKAIEETLELDPNNKNFWYNLGVISQNLGNTEKAVAAYDKVIELDPKYRNAYINKGVVIISQEQDIVKELNKNRGTKKYSEIKEKLNNMYLDAIPLFEKAYELKKDEEVRSNLKALYKAINQPEKAKNL
ncbi:tetratricopeptide repeat protein [Wenyingzhuangia sp. chi5]|uniref:Tetratricopeptide repeat protein n=1 Tax=Wenyingzhuangia gilva TaxID=3057677 RepID=A0ABT8VTF9_9FLAO|nr:tetratricopeptide repeat protein [Wenyingzhuangia sp. chi5]MDO3695264.1 tetratricopeptide repeat protein [Wenyingzhuangia sp. chi5]